MNVKEYVHIATQTGKACANDLPYRWRKHEYNISGTYTDTVKVAPFNIPDTVYTLQLAVGSRYEYIEHFDLCPGHSVTYRGKTYTDTGRDTIYLPSASGCDSMFIVQVTMYPTYIFTEDAELCTGSSFIWTGHHGDMVYTHPGIYYDSLSTVNGCDSVYELRLFMGEPDVHKDTVIVCEHDLPYPFGGHWLTETGIYYDTIPRGRNMCDSIVRLALTVLKDQRETKTVTFCQGTGVRHNKGELFYDARTYVDTVRTPKEGCYNIITTVYTPGPVYRLQELIHRKADEVPYEWHGKKYTKDGIYQDKHLNAEGCDSIWELQLVTDYDVFVDSVICQGDTVFYKDEPVYYDRIFTDSLVTRSGGDSVIHRSYTFAPRYYSIEATSICSNEYLPWPGHEHIVLHEEGAYFDRYTTALGCDSIFEIDVTVNKAYSKSSYMAISAYHAADSLPYVWTDGHNIPHYLSNDTVITDTLGHTPLKYNRDYIDSDNVWHRSLSGGCDSTVSIEFQVIRKYNFDTIPLCPNGYVIVDGRKYTTPGDYEHWLLSSPYSHHNDSIHYFHIYLADTYDSEQYDTATICSNEAPYLWYSRVCYTSGEYTDTIPTVFGCDSIVHLHLSVLPAYYFTEIHNICKGDSVKVNGKWLHQPGIYYDSLHTKAGCDSVYKIVVNMVRNYFFPDTAHIQQGNTYTWHKDGQPWVLNRPGVYFDSCRTVADGCDSVYRLLLIEDKTYFYTEEQTVCEENLPYPWHNMVIYNSGTYYDSLSTQFGMDSVYELNLTVYPKFFQIQTINTCSDEGYTINDKHFDHSGVYIDTLRTQFGCDSVIEYHVNVGTSFVIDEQMHMGPKAEIEWHGQTLTHPGVYLDSLLTIGGCDSIIRLTLIEDPTYNFYDTARICRSEAPYRWLGKDYYASGDYEQLYASKFKMDSIHHLHLTIDPTRDTTIYIDRCSDDPYIWRGKPVYKSGNYADTMRTVLGCDSVINYVVNFHPTFFEPDTVHFINGTSVTWHDRVLTDGGTYYDSLVTALGCDSIYQLTLIVADTFVSVENITYCEDDLPYIWHGKNLTATGDYADQHKTVYGADSSYYIHFTVAPKYDSIQYATICHGGQINYFGRVIREAGIYSDTLLSQFGCDSVQTLIVNWTDEKFSEQTVRLCYGETFTINERTFTQSGIYDDTLRTTDGCDSIVRYSVQIMQRYHFEDTKAINPGQQYIWYGHYNDTILTTAGVYLDTLTSVEGCDSTFRLTITVHPEYLQSTTADICAGDFYTWRGKNYYESGIYDDSLQTIFHCDSIFRLVLNVHDTTIVDQYYDFCLGQAVGLGSKTFTTSGIYYDTIPSEYNCPQITRHIIRFHPEYRIARTKVLSDGEEYDFYGRILTKPGVYTHNVPTAFGCDSLIVLTLSYCADNTETTVHLNLCQGDTIQLGDTILTKAGQYYRTYPSKYGCDSVVHYIVKENPTYHWTSYATFCLNEPYRWIGHMGDTLLTKAGRYNEWLKTTEGCDSIYTLVLTTAESFLHDTTIYLCQDEVPYVHNGQEYYTDMEFRDSLRALNGCDSIIVTRYHLHDHCSDIDLFTRCEGDALIIDGRMITEDGEYRYQIGGDSIHRFNVLSYPVYNYSINIGSFCDSVFYEGEMYYARGDGKETFTVDRLLHTVHNCDSIEHVTMTIYQSAPTLQHTQTIYDYSSVLFGGELYNETGTYTHRYHTIHGCDSTAILHLNVIPTDSTGALHFHYCYASADNIEVFGKLYHPAKDTIIFDTTAIPDVGMWIIKKAIVLVTYPFSILSIQAETEVCATNNIQFDILLNLNGSTPERYELDFLPSQLSVAKLHQEGFLNGTNTIPVEMDGRGLCVSPGYYPYRLTLTASDCHMSDTIIDSSITVRYPTTIMEANWNNVVALINENYNDGRWKLMPPYQWQVWSEAGQDKTALVSPNNGLPYLYSDQLEPGDRIIVNLLREGYTQPVPSCEYVFYPATTDGRAPILVYPTAARKMTPITIESTVQGTYTLFNNTGARIAQGEFYDGKQTLTMPATAGCYLLNIEAPQQASQIKKIIVY
ncbi:MAG: hypothetical protein MJZ65_04980 [Paludibacteraceae bacterium]|nr:hypothetical protein [Paludibacteraceae bacterium]